MSKKLTDYKFLISMKTKNLIFFCKRLAKELKTMEIRNCGDCG